MSPSSWVAWTNHHPPLHWRNSGLVHRQEAPADTAVVLMILENQASVDGAMTLCPWLSDNPVEESGAFSLSKLVVMLAAEWRRTEALTPGFSPRRAGPGPRSSVLHFDFTTELLWTLRRGSTIPGPPLPEQGILSPSWTLEYDKDEDKQDHSKCHLHSRQGGFIKGKSMSLFSLTSSCLGLGCFFIGAAQSAPRTSLSGGRKY